MTRSFEAFDAPGFMQTCSSSGFAAPRQQISRAFTDGVQGTGFAGRCGAAVIVGDMVELIGCFDELVLDRLLRMDESHLMEPPDCWTGDIAKHPGARMQSYSRTAFKPITPDRARALSANPVSDELPVFDGDAIEIVPIDPRIVPTLLSETWSADLVSHTMVDNRSGDTAFGYVACLGSEIVGGVGCYALYSDGIEVEIDTREGFQRHGVANALASRMLRECGRRNLSCHWDAMNAASAGLATKLGFTPERTYPAVILKPDQEG